MNKWRDEWTAYLMIVPAVLYVAVLAFYPAVNAVYGSFFTRLGNFDGISAG